MKTINDFKIIDGIAVLEGVAFVQEAKVVDEFLKKNMNIARVSVIAKDGRYFELKEGRLVQTKEKTFSNPYFVGETEEKVKETETKAMSVDNDIEKRIVVLEKNVEELKNINKKLLNSIKQIIGSFVND